MQHLKAAQTNWESEIPVRSLETFVSMPLGVLFPLNAVSIQISFQNLESTDAWRPECQSGMLVYSEPWATAATSHSTLEKATAAGAHQWHVGRHPMERLFEANPEFIHFPLLNYLGNFW